MTRATIFLCREQKAPENGNWMLRNANSRPQAIASINSGTAAGAGIMPIRRGHEDQRNKF
jgi:hypothetical protein